MTYDYKCDKCNLIYSVERSIHAEASTPSCPDCSGVMSRLWGDVPVTFSGGGFYSTDK